MLKTPSFVRHLFTAPEPVIALPAAAAAAAANGGVPNVGDQINFDFRDDGAAFGAVDDANAGAQPLPNDNVPNANANDDPHAEALIGGNAQ